MSKEIIKKDSYSLYFKINDEVYRPIQTFQTMEEYGHILPLITETRFRENSKVVVRKLSNGLASVTVEGSLKKEKWFLHGTGRSTKQWFPAI
jgi:hypothetical protein